MILQLIKYWYLIRQGAEAAAAGIYWTIRQLPVAGWARVLGLLVASYTIYHAATDLAYILGYGAGSGVGPAMIAERIQTNMVLGYSLSLVVAGALFVCAGIAGIKPSPGGHRWLNRAFGVFHVFMLVCILMLAAALSEASALMNPESAEGEADMWFELMFDFGWPLAVQWIALLIGHVCHLRQSSLDEYAVERDREAPGDRFLEVLRTGGGDPDYHRAWKRMITTFLVLMLLPFLMPSGCDRYAIPPGSGTPAAPPPMVTQVVEEEKEEFILADDSPILFDRPDPTESTAVQQLVQRSERTYEASTNGAPGAVGEGGGTEGGWPDGTQGPFRFIRIRHGGVLWNDGMDAKTGNADRNFMVWLEKTVNLPQMTIATRSEAMTVSQIYNDFEEGFRPPFVYLTSNGRFSLSTADRRNLRKLLLEGTMLFADAGSPDFHRSFTALMRQVFPDKQLVNISDEDPILRFPNAFPNGLMSNQWHGPPRAMGIKHEKRWIVFYHPGDANDLWKDEAARVDKHIRNNALSIGYNIVWYAFTRYLEQNRELRK